MASPRTAPLCPAAGHIRWAGQWALGSRQALLGPCLLSVPLSSFGAAPRGRAQDTAFAQLPVGATMCSCRQLTRAAASVAWRHVPQSTGGRADLGRAGAGSGSAVFLGVFSSGPDISSSGTSEWTFLFKETCLCAVSLRHLRAVQMLRLHRAGVLLDKSSVGLRGIVWCPLPPSAGGSEGSGCSCHQRDRW